MSTVLSYTDLNDEEVKEIQVKALQFLKNYLEEKNISYFIVAGTLLGAVRHKGFIPWDDDIDIGMERKDYENFIKVFHDEMNRGEIKDYFLQNWKTDKNFSMPFSKLRVNNTVYIEETTEKVEMHNGIYIDIFPFDNVYEEEKLKFFQKILSKYLAQIILLKSDYKLSEKKIIVIIRSLTKILPKKILISIFEKINTKAPDSSEKMVCTGGSYGFDKETIYKKWFIEKTKLKFENIDLPAPKLYDEYLKNLYGKYNVLPAEKDRISRHKIIEKKILN